MAESWIAEGFFIKRILGILDLPRSTYYERLRVKREKIPGKRGRPIPGYSLHENGYKIPDEQIEEYLMEFHYHDEIGALGYKKWSILLTRKYNIIINKRKVLRLANELGITKEVKRKASKYPRKLAKNRRVTGSNQLWQIDIKYSSVEDTNYFVFVCSVIDVYDRSIVGYYRGPTCKAKDITGMVNRALIKREVHLKQTEGEEKLILRSDNGPQFISEKFVEFCAHQRIYHERIPPKSPDMNAYIESFHSVLQRECFDRHLFHFYEEAYHYIDSFIAFYNEERPHGSLKGLFPHEVYELSKTGENPLKMISL